MYVHIRVVAGAKKELIKKLKADHYAVSVKEPAERNMANRRVTEILADHFGVSAGKIRLISGHRSPSKIFRADVD